MPQYCIAEWILMWPDQQAVLQYHTIQTRAVSFPLQTNNMQDNSAKHQKYGNPNCRTCLLCDACSY
eukprot:796264-Amphidinium_carterae.1